MTKTETFKNYLLRDKFTSEIITSATDLEAAKDSQKMFGRTDNDSIIEGTNEDLLYLHNRLFIISEAEAYKNTKEYEIEEMHIQRLTRMSQIQDELKVLDEKCVRAVLEPSEKEPGLTWQQYYTNQKEELRAELKTLTDLEAEYSNN